MNKLFGRKKKILLDNKEDKVAKHIPLRKYTKGGRTSCLIALISLVLIIIDVIITILMRGKAGIYVWLIALFAFIVAAAGFAVGINSFKEENKFLRYTYLGTIANAVIWLGLVGMYLIFV